MAILKTADLARRYQLSQTCVRNYANSGRLPYGFRIGFSRRWLSDELDAWDAEQNQKQKEIREAI